MITHYKIYGERCTGTNYLEELISSNFDIEPSREGSHAGSKHFFGFNKLENTDHVLFLCIVRNPVDWFNSILKKPYHIPSEIYSKVPKFLNSEWYSIYNKPNQPLCGREIIQDRNIYTGKRYKNIFELRHIKHKFLIDDLPTKVKNYILIRHEDLLNDFDNTMINIKNKGIPIKPDINFPINIYWDCKKKNKKPLYNPDKSDDKPIKKKRIKNHKQFNDHYEKILNYNL